MPPSRGGGTQIVASVSFDRRVRSTRVSNDSITQDEPTWSLNTADGVREAQRWLRFERNNRHTSRCSAETILTLTAERIIGWATTTGKKKPSGVHNIVNKTPPAPSCLSRWSTGRHLWAKEAGTDRPEPFMWQRNKNGGKAWIFDQNCVSFKSKIAIFEHIDIELPCLPGYQSHKLSHTHENFH